MAKFCGDVIYSRSRETSPGVWTEETVARPYTGDVLSRNWRWENSQQVNDNLNVSNRISIVADQFAYENMFAIKAVKWSGACWKVTDVEQQRPRLILSIGGVYNDYEEPTGTSCETDEDSQ